MTTVDVALVIAALLMLAVGIWALLGIGIETVRERREETDR